MSDYEVSLGKAREVVDTEPTPNVHIHITEELPDWDHMGGLQLWADYCQRQADRLERALRDSLPGGVYDRLLGAMLLHRSSYFRVPHGGKKDVPVEARDAD